MALREVRQTGDEILRKISKEVTDFDEKLHSLLEDMEDTMKEEDGVGIAAVQIGVLRRVFLIELDEQVMEFINPVILERTGSQVGMEGCLSVIGENGFVERPQYVKIEAQDRNGEKFVFEANDFAAIVVSHEYDHLDGHLYTDFKLSEEQLKEMGYELVEAEEE